MPRGRPKLYFTEEERRAARREAQQRYRNNKKTDKEFNRFMTMQPLYTSKPKLDELQKEFIHSLHSLPVSNTPIKVDKNEVTEARKQLSEAFMKLKASEFSTISFDLSKMNQSNVNYFISHLYNFIDALLHHINLEDDKYIIAYQYNDLWRDRTLTVDNSIHLLAQIRDESNSIRYDLTMMPLDYDFFPIRVRELQKFSVINTSNTYYDNGSWSDVPSKYKAKEFKSLQQYRTYQLLLKHNADEETIQNHLKFSLKKRRKKTSGKFWPYYLTLSNIDLSRQMIFHKLDKSTAQIIERDNCFIYACRMSGVPDAVIDDMRCSVKTHELSFATINELAHTYGLRIKLRESSRTRIINDSGTTQINLLLLHNHYMLNEKVNVSPYYIIHRSEINKDPKAKYYTLTRKQHIYGYVGGRYLFNESMKFSLRKVISALFEMNYFTPISLSDYAVYSSLLCFEAVESIKSLDYEPRYCCQLKS